MSSSVVHVGITCDSCGVSPIQGVRYKCGHCRDFDLCSTCESNSGSTHDQNHVFLKIKRPFPSTAAQAGPYLPNFYDDSSTLPRPVVRPVYRD